MAIFLFDGCQNIMKFAWNALKNYLHAARGKIAGIPLHLNLFEADQ